MPNANCASAFTVSRGGMQNTSPAYRRWRRTSSGMFDSVETTDVIVFFLLLNEVDRWSGQDRQLRDGHDESGTPLSDKGDLAHDLVLEVPRQDQYVIGSRLTDARRRVDRQSRAGEEAALLVWAAVDGVADQILADTAVVQQGVAFGGRTIGHRGGAEVARLDEEAKQIAFDAADLLGISDVTIEGVELRVMLGTFDVTDTAGRVVSAEAGVAGIYPQRSAVGVDLLDVEDAQTLGGEDATDGEQREVREVFVVDRVELVLFDQLQDMGELH